MNNPCQSVPAYSDNASLKTLLAPQLEAVNDCILQKLDSSVELIPQVAKYLISLGGKRLRPLLTVASAELCGYKGERHIHMAACVEFIHTATLLHDDVVDGSSLRRGKKSANTLWSNKASILVGDFLFSRAFELMVENGSLEVLQILSSASSVIAEGEVMQLSASHNLGLTQDEYLNIIGCKTARLFSAATEVGAVLAEASPEEREALLSFGLNLGIAFQLMDDLLDYTAEQDKLGKTIGDDFREGKVTLPIILAASDETQRPFWEQVFKNPTDDARTLDEAIRKLKQSGALTQTKALAEEFIEKAVGSLTLFSDCALKDALINLAYSSLRREK